MILIFTNRRLFKLDSKVCVFHLGSKGNLDCSKVSLQIMFLLKMHCPLLVKCFSWLFIFEFTLTSDLMSVFRELIVPRFSYNSNYKQQNDYNQYLQIQHQQFPLMLLAHYDFSFHQHASVSPQWILELIIQYNVHLQCF